MISITAAALEIFVIVASPYGDAATGARSICVGSTRTPLKTETSGASPVIITEQIGEMPSRETIRSAAVAQMRALRDRAIANGMELMSVDAINAAIRADREDQT